jgi:hypothetical protein
MLMLLNLVPPNAQTSQWLIWQYSLRRTKIALIDDEEEKTAILNAKRGFVEAAPTPISYEVFLHSALFKLMQ